MAWPAPMLQPDRRKGCGLYATAYLCRCLGCADVPAKRVETWCRGTHILEFMYPHVALGYPMVRAWDAYERGDEPEFRRYWLGQDARVWVEHWLACGHIAIVQVFRVPQMAHALVLLETRGDVGVLVMDPLHGHVIEPWDWFLGSGPGREGAHHIEGWFRIPRVESAT